VLCSLLYIHSSTAQGLPDTAAQSGARPPTLLVKHPTNSYTFKHEVQQTITIETEIPGWCFPSMDVS